MPGSGTAVPWVWVRRLLAQRWGVPPFEVEDWPAVETQLELELLALEAEAARG